MANRPKVFIGGDNSPGRVGGAGPGGLGAYPNDGVVRRYVEAANEWQWVQQNVDGYFFALQPFYNDDDSWIPRMAGLLRNKNAFVETDLVHSTLSWDTDWMEKLRSHGFRISYAAINKNDGSDAGERFSPERVAGLRAYCPGGALAMGAAFTADDGALSWDPWTRAIAAMDGCATDGPMGFWWTDIHGMKGRTRQAVYYTRGVSKISMVMLAPFTCRDQNVSFLTAGQDCVRWLENLATGSAAPDVWVISSYIGGDPAVYPATPETNRDGSPADTVTGLAYWLINHLRDPAGWP